MARSAAATARNTYSIDADVSSVGLLFVCSARANADLTPTDTITVTYPGFSGMTTAIASEYAGISAVDQHRACSGNSATPNSGSVTTIQPNELLFVAIALNNSPVLTVGCGFLASGEVATAAGGGQKSIDTGHQVTTATGTFSACGTLSLSDTWWQAAIAAYR